VLIFDGFRQEKVVQLVLVPCVFDAWTHGRNIIPVNPLSPSSAVCMLVFSARSVTDLHGHRA
jgi:hypothetical protein